MRRVGMLLSLVLFAAGGVLVSPGSAGAASDAPNAVSVKRYGGADRYATSLLIAEAMAADAGGSLSSVVLVSGQRWTDAVVAAPVAGALGAPVLMTPPDELRGDALAFMQRVGVTRALVIGPDGSGDVRGPGRRVTTAVLDALARAGISVERVEGSSLYSTSVAAAERVTPGVMPRLGRTAIVASVEVFADALVAGPFAARGTHPVLLSASDELPGSVAGYLSAAGIEHVVVMGGTAALSADVQSSIEQLGVKVTRLAGKTRYDTAVKAAELVTDRYNSTTGQDCFATDTIGLARARVPFDAFSAGPLLGRLCAPLLLADPDSIPAETARFFDQARSAAVAAGTTQLDLRVFGGNAAISHTAIDAYLDNTSDSVSVATFPPLRSWLVPLVEDYPYVHQVGTARVHSDISAEFSHEHAVALDKTFRYFGDLYGDSPGPVVVAFYTQNANVFKKVIPHCPTIFLPNARVVTRCLEGIVWWFVIPFQIPDFGTILHEIGHEFVWETFRDGYLDASWYVEGTAMYFESGEFDPSGDLIVSEPLQWCTGLYAAGEARGELIPLRRLMSMPRGEFLADAGNTYSQSCMLFHYLADAHPGVLDELIKRIRSGAVVSNEQLIDSLLELVAQDTEQLEASFRGWMSR